jgi:hypothetical protein
MSAVCTIAYERVALDRWVETLRAPVSRSKSTCATSQSVNAGHRMKRELVEQKG